MNPCGGRIRVLTETAGAELTPLSTSLLHLAADLATDRDLAVHAILDRVPDDPDHLAAVTGRRGASVVAVPETELDAIDLTAALINDQGQDPGLILAPATPLGTEVAARVGARLGVPVLHAVTSIEWRDGHLTVTCPAFDGKASARRVIDAEPAPAATITVSEGAFSGVETVARPPARIARLHTGEINMSEQPRPRVISRAPTPPEELALDEVDVVIAGGMGLGGPAGFDLLREFAELVGGRVGASRMVTDRGWISTDALVGQTGATVAPSIYVACGISGAPQHLIGMRDSATVIAINTDANAAISQVADVLFVADVNELVPAMIELIACERSDPAEAAA